MNKDDLFKMCDLIVGMRDAYCYNCGEDPYNLLSEGKIAALGPQLVKCKDRAHTGSDRGRESKSKTIDRIVMIKPPNVFNDDVFTPIILSKKV